MNPDVAGAIEDLLKREILSPAQAELPLRAARREIVSLRLELRVLLYVGVLLVAGGAGLLVKENLEAIGPVGIALGLLLASGCAFVWVARVAPPFSRGEVSSPNLAFDYVLLLGVLLAASDLAFVEVKFTPVGANWAWHLLIVSLATGAIAIRYDSRVVFSIALSSFAAWRGVSVSPDSWWDWFDASDNLRMNLLICGGLFIVLGAALVRARVKAHFEPVAVNLGCLLALSALASGAGQVERSRGVAYSAVLVIVATALGTWAWFRARFSVFAISLIGAYVGVCGLVLRGLEIPGEGFTMGWFFVSSAVVLAALIKGQRAMRSER